MKVLLVNKFHYLKGGSEQYYFNLADLLASYGNEVAFFSMYDEKNIKTKYKEYFINSIDLNSKNVSKALDVIYSKNNKKKMKEVLDDFKPDVVHLNNFQRQLSASIIAPIKQRKIPLVYTAHDLQAICPAILMLDKNKTICEKCINGKYINCIKSKCIKDSNLKSLLGAIETRYYRMKKVYQNEIDCIISPSAFVKEKLVQDGIDSKKIKVINNFINLEEYDLNVEDKGYALYCGRLSKEKGILNLVEAFSKIKNEQLYIVGTGPEEENIKKIIKQNNLKNIRMLGYLNKEKLKDVLRNSSFVVLPSIWYENCPYSIIEAQAIGKAVVCSKIGGIPELIDDGKDGLLYKYNDIDELIEKINKMFKDKTIRKNMEKNAKEKAKKYSKENYYNELIKVYKSIKEK